VITRSSLNALYDRSLASFAESGGSSPKPPRRLHRAVVAAVADGLAAAHGGAKPDGD